MTPDRRHSRRPWMLSQAEPQLWLAGSLALLWVVVEITKAWP